MKLSDTPFNRAANGAPAPKLVLPFLSVGTLATAGIVQFLKDVDVILDVSPVINEDEEETEAYEAPAKASVEYINLRYSEEGDIDEEETYLGNLFKKAYETLKGLKADNKKVLVVSTERQYVVGVVLSYKIYSSNALEKDWPLTEAIAFVKTKDPQRVPGDVTLLALAVLEEELYDEISVPLPSNARAGKKKQTKKPANKNRR